MVAGIEECSNSEFGVGPLGPLITAENSKIQVYINTAYNESRTDLENTQQKIPYF